MHGTLSYLSFSWDLEEQRGWGMLSRHHLEAMQATKGGRGAILMLKGVFSLSNTAFIETLM